LRERIDLAAHRKNRRWIVDHSQALRVFRFAKGEKFDTRCVSAAMAALWAKVANAGRTRGPLKS